MFGNLSKNLVKAPHYFNNKTYIINKIFKKKINNYNFVIFLILCI